MLVKILLKNPLFHIATTLAVENKAIFHAFRKVFHSPRSPDDRTLCRFSTISTITDKATIFSVT